MDVDAQWMCSQHYFSLHSVCMLLTNSGVTQGHGLTEKRENLISIPKDCGSIHLCTYWLIIHEVRRVHMEITIFVEVSGCIYRMLHLICFSNCK